MKSSNLVRNVGRVVFGTAIAGFGLSLGRDVYKKSKKTVGDTWIAMLFIAAIMAAIFGAIYLPYKAVSKIVQWYPSNPITWLFLTLLPWAIAGTIGIWLAYYVGEIIYYSFMYELPSGIDIESEPGIGMKTFEASASYKDFLMAYVGYIACNAGLGLLVGFKRRDKRRRAYAVEIFNQKFLDKHQIKEVDGSDSFTHKDGRGNKLRLTNVGKDVVEFFVVGGRNKRAFIKIDGGGKFNSYTGVVSIG